MTTNPTPKRPDWADAFLANLAECGVVKYAAELAGVSRSAPYDLADRDPVFKAEMAEANQAATQTAIREAWRRAVEGVDEPVFHQGSVCGLVRKYDSSLLMFLIKQRDPSFRESTKVEHSGRVDIATLLQGASE